MLKLVVLSILMAAALAAPAPGYLGAGSLLTAPVHSAGPSITSSSSSVVHSTALLHAAAPALAAPALHGGLLSAAPALHGGLLSAAPALHGGLLAAPAALAAAPALHGGLVAAPAAVLAAPALDAHASGLTVLPAGISAHGLLGAGSLALGVHGIH